MTATLLPGINPREMKTYIQTKTCTHKHEKTGEEPKYPSTDEWINKTVSTNGLYQYLVKTKNKILIQPIMFHEH